MRKNMFYFKTNLINIDNHMASGVRFSERGNLLPLYHGQICRFIQQDYLYKQLYHANYLIYTTVLLPFVAVWSEADLGGAPGTRPPPPLYFASYNFIIY